MRLVASALRERKRKRTGEKGTREKEKRKKAKLKKARAPEGDPEETGASRRRADARAVEAAALLRKAGNIRIHPKHSECPPPVTTFDGIESIIGGAAGRPRRELLALMLENMRRSYRTIDAPSPIQQQAVPLLLKRRDVICVAPTGSGKTLAYLLPMMLALERPLKSADAAAAAGPRGLIVCPTKELAVQIHRVLTNVIVPASTGPRRWSFQIASKKTVMGVQWGAVDVMIGTPATINAGITKGRVRLDAVEMLVLDEADKLFESGRGGAGKARKRDKKAAEEAGGDGDEGDGAGVDGAADTTFLSQLDGIVRACSNPSKCSALFTATLPESVEALARAILREDLVRVTVGERNTAVNNIMQTLVYCGRTEQEKLRSLRSLLNPRHLINPTITGAAGAAGGAANGSPKAVVPPVLIFTQSKERAHQLYLELYYDGIKIGIITADRTDRQRADAVDAFRAGEIWILICTDLLARGMDFSSVQTVISYDFPTTTTNYIHRVGRAGRGGRGGCQAITLFTEDDVNFGLVRPVAQVIKNSGNSVPDWLLNVEPRARDAGNGAGRAKGARGARLVAPQRRDISTKIVRRYNKMKAQRSRARREVKKK